MRTAVIIDDNIDEVELLEQALKEADPLIDCICLVFPDEALFVIENEFKICPEFIFLNTEVKRKSGMACLLRLGVLPTLRKSTIVILTKVLPPPLVEVYQNLGADFAFQTPTSKSQYKDLIFEVMQKSSRNVA
ncbi:response regulator [Pseudochryseolinea flava]|uniref:Response regulatory domain-containing protein n=1 Tax=Pseudochryseolinea flava TaxID=2059302 RepID=A0A364Y5P3_9BACT|nr:hypothetical protein [Pseudochryseolinea flava]RAW01545.1 hypothetical protein DQQ10_07750 [Pseudochryseolinea flava]